MIRCRVDSLLRYERMSGRESRCERRRIGPRPER